MLKKLESLFANPKSVDSHDISSVVKMEKFLIINEPAHQISTIVNNAVPIVNVDDIVESHKDLIRRIDVVCGFSTEAFEELVMPIIRNYAQYVHLLPATCNENHSAPGGLFHLGLEVGFYAAQTSDGELHPRKLGVASSECHRKWVFATFIAGLCSQIYRPMTTMRIVSDRGYIWPSPLKPFYTWSKEIDSKNFKIIWIENNITLEKNFNSAAAYVLNMIIPNQCIQYLIDDNLEILSCMASAITGNSTYSVKNSINKSVTSALSSVVEKDMKC